MCFISSAFFSLYSLFATLAPHSSVRFYNIIPPAEMLLLLIMTFVSLNQQFSIEGFRTANH